MGRAPSDLQGERFGDLEALYCVGRAREEGKAIGYIWRFRCVCEGGCGVDHNGICGNTRALPVNEVSKRNRHFACQPCAERRQLRGRPTIEIPPPRRRRLVTVNNYQRLRANFSEEQWRAYYRYLGARETTGRAGVFNQIEAVDLALVYSREGGCCELCDKGLLRAHAQYQRRDEG